MTRDKSKEGLYKSQSLSTRSIVSIKILIYEDRRMDGRGSWGLKLSLKNDGQTFIEALRQHKNC